MAEKTYLGLLENKNVQNCYISGLIIVFYV